MAVAYIGVQCIGTGTVKSAFYQQLACSSFCIVHLPDLLCHEF